MSFPALKKKSLSMLDMSVASNVNVLFLLWTEVKNIYI